MAKDRAAPFSRKHRRYWGLVLGGMILIGVANVALGFLLKPDVPTGPVERIVPVVPKSTLYPDARLPAPDARGVSDR